MVLWNILPVHMPMHYTLLRMHVFRVGVEKNSAHRWNLWRPKGQLLDLPKSFEWNRLSLTITRKSRVKRTTCYVDSYELTNKPLWIAGRNPDTWPPSDMPIQRKGSQLSRCHIEGLFYLLSTHRKSYDTVEGVHTKFVRQDSILCPSWNQRWEDFIISHRHFYLHVVLIRDGRKVRTIVRSRLDRISAFAWIKLFASYPYSIRGGRRLVISISLAEF